MILQLKLFVAKMLLKETDLLRNISFTERRTLSEPDTIMDKTNSIKIDIENFTIPELRKLRVKISEHVGKAIVDKLDRWIEVATNPNNNIEIKDVDTFKKLLVAMVEKDEVKWFWGKLSDDSMVPYLVKDIKIIPAAKRTPRHCLVELVYGTITNEGKIFNNAQSDRRFFYQDMLDRDEFDEEVEDVMGYFDLEALKEDDDEAEEKVVTKSTKKSPKIKGLPLQKILLKKNIYYHSDALKQQYIDQYDNWKRIQLTLVGKQFTSSGMGYSVSSSYWGSGLVSFFEDKMECKLVVESIPTEQDSDGMSITYKNKWGMHFLPYHLYVFCYDITKHRDVKVHVSLMKQYVYNKNLLQHLIISDTVKGLVNSLIDGEIAMEGKDLIKGKSGGITVLCYGPPGNGKTLTGEIYSEYVEKPLYQIQSSQLGISVSDIESNLSKVLRRAERWNCILMIDEADTYIYKRGQDILQNCIVGTFLRLMEYYNGILFLTTNRQDIIDEAIMSRVTVSICYKNPPHDSLVKIWETHYRSYGINISKEEISKVAEEFPMSGRDVRNCLKLISRYYDKDEAITADHIRKVKEYLPSIE
jgi:hypothetical protein